MNYKPQIQRVWFNGREFQRTTWRGQHGRPNVTVVWAVTKRRPGIMRGIRTGRREF